MGQYGNIERAYFEVGSTEVRIDGAGEITGYAAVFYDGSPRTEFRAHGISERIMPGAFDPVLGNDVRGLFNHDDNQILGRTSAGTMQIGVDHRGLHFRIKPGNSAVHQHVMESVRRGDVRGASFGFTVDKHELRYDGSEQIREIRSLGKLFDVGPVTFPAYEATEAQVRSLQGQFAALRRNELIREFEASSVEAQAEACRRAQSQR